MLALVSRFLLAGQGLLLLRLRLRCLHQHPHPHPHPHLHQQQHLLLHLLLRPLLRPLRSLTTRQKSHKHPIRLTVHAGTKKEFLSRIVNLRKKNS